MLTSLSYKFTQQTGPGVPCWVMMGFSPVLKGLCLVRDGGQSHEELSDNDRDQGSRGMVKAEEVARAQKMDVQGQVVLGLSAPV